MPITGRKISRLENDSVTLASEEILAYIENNDDCQFPLQKLNCKNPATEIKTLEIKLKAW